MSAKWVTSDPAVSRLIEKQMRNWELARAQHYEKPKPPIQEVADFVTISRAVGAGGAEVARLLGQRLGWPVFDRQILQAMAGEDHIRQALYESMDERDVTWLEEAVRSWSGGEFARNDYFRKLTETVLALARQARTVFLGRGIDLILPQERGLRVRLTAPRAQRIARIAEITNLPPAQAERELGEREQARAEYLRKHFPHRPPEEDRFDLVVNRRSLTYAQCADLIVLALKQRGMAD